MHQRLTAAWAAEHRVIGIAAVARLDIPHPHNRGSLREQMPVDNGRMGVVDMVKRHLTPVFDLLVGQVALNVVLL